MRLAPTQHLGRGYSANQGNLSWRLISLYAGVLDANFNPKARSCLGAATSEQYKPR